MYSVELEKAEQLSEEELRTGIHLWVIHADKIPPHIGISRNGLFYSLKIHGKDTGIPSDKILKVLIQKEIPVIVFRTSENSLRFQTLSEVYDQYEKIRPAENSCLTPISHLYFGEPKDLILEELLDLLLMAGVLEDVYKLNLKEDFKGIPEYTRTDIKNHIENLLYAEG